MPYARSVSVTAVLLAVLSVASCSDSDAQRPGAVTTGDPARTFAPLVAVHPDERSSPMAAEEFLGASTLRWRDGCGERALATGARLDPARLSGHRSPYRHRARRAPGCRPAKAFATDGYTRPFDSLRANDIAPDEGFFLDLEDGRRETGRPASAAGIDTAAYFERKIEHSEGRPAWRITYWLLFPFDHQPGPSKVVNPIATEGDWERASVLLRPVGDDEYVPLSLRLGGVDGIVTPWRKLRRTSSPHGDSHPLVFAARGSHALQTRPGRAAFDIFVNGRRHRLHHETRGCPPCRRWPTWRKLVNARGEPWYGYGGAWGDSPGQQSTPAGLGPSRWTEIRLSEAS
jgi:hypothetical protein